MRDDRTTTLRFYSQFIKPWHESDKTIGVIISGGFDSAVLWHLVYKECLKRSINIKPFTVPKVDGSIRHAELVLKDYTQFKWVLWTTIIETQTGQYFMVSFYQA